MSYILDALRKADAERERGAVPDLHAQLLPPGRSEFDAEPVRSSLLLWLGAGLLLAIGAGVVWWAMGGSDSAAPVPMVATPALPAPATVAVPAASMPVATANIGAEAPQAAPQPAPSSESAVPQPTPKAAARPKALASAPAATTAQPRIRPAASAKAASAPANQSPAAPARPPTLADLPADLRQQVPPLAIGGSVYSPQASVRMVIVNGQVFQEGNSLAPELKLEQIRPKTAVFSIRGQRFEVPL
jgi:general secretion pathway protein B